MVGGAIGIVVGAGGVLVLMLATDWTMVIAGADIALPFGLSVAMGLLFGVIPALKASRLAPVEALRAA